MPRRNGLDKNAVVQAAAELIDREGAQALTLNRLAAELSIQPPSLYNHIDGMPGLLHSLALLNARRLGERLSEAAMGHAGTEGVLRVSEAYRGYIKENPALYSLNLRDTGGAIEEEPELHEAGERAVHVVLVILESLGLRGEDALHAARGLRSAVHGFATLEVEGGFGLPLDLDESFRRLITSLVEGFSREANLAPGGAG